MVIHYQIAKCAQFYLFFIYQFFKYYLLCYRYTAYILSVYGRLGRKRKKVIPACVMLAIWMQFPEADGNYRKGPCISRTFFHKIEAKNRAAYPWIHLCLEFSKTN